MDVTQTIETSQKHDTSSTHKKQSHSNSNLKTFSLPPCPEGCVLRLILCRHGETDLNASHILQGSGVDPSLNNRGRRQASQLANRLSSLDLDLVVSSGLKRAIETAEVIASLHSGVETAVYKNLAEISWGIYEGQVSPDLNKLHSEWNGGNFDYAAPGGETPVAVSKRAEAAFKEIVQRVRTKSSHSVAHVVAVAHGRFLRIAISWLLHKSLHYMHTIAHFNCNINVIDVCAPVLCGVLHQPQMLSQISQSDLSRISQLIVDQQTKNAYGSRPVPLEKSCLTYSQAAAIGSSVGAAWNWGEIYFPETDAINPNNNSQPNIKLLSGNEKILNNSIPCICRKPERMLLWLVGTLLNDTSHLDIPAILSPSVGFS